MEAIREFAQLEGSLLTLRLPPSFKAKRVEVIVMPTWDVGEPEQGQAGEARRKPSPKLKGTQISGDIMSPVVAAKD